MSEVSYSNVPPMMAAIKSGDIEAIRSLLHAGHSPNEPQCYQVMIGDWPRDDEASPLELAVLENRMDMVQLLIECGADLTHNPEELLCGSLRSQDLTLFSFLVDVGVRIPATQRDICRLFLHLVDRDEPNVLPILKRMGMDLKQYGGEALRSMASHGNQLLVEYLIQNGADINYHKPDMVFPYASTPVTDAVMAIPNLEAAALQLADRSERRYGGVQKAFAAAGKSPLLREEISALTTWLLL